MEERGNQVPEERALPGRPGVSQPAHVTARFDPPPCHLQKISSSPFILPCPPPFSLYPLSLSPSFILPCPSSLPPSLPSSPSLPLPPFLPPSLPPFLPPSLPPSLRPGAECPCLGSCHYEELPQWDARVQVWYERQAGH